MEYRAELQNWGILALHSLQEPPQGQLGPLFHRVQERGRPVEPSDFRQKTGTASMEAYKLETHKILKRFLSGQTNFPACIAALDSAFATLTPDFNDLGELRTVMLANNETVMQEMHKRTGRDGPG